MAFEAKRLRVQLPSGKAVRLEEGKEEPLAADEAIIKGVCVDEFSWHMGSCLDDFTTALLVTLAPLASIEGEALQTLREHLEAQLQDVTAAEQKLVDDGLGH